MGLNNKRRWLLALLAAGGFNTSLNAEVVYQDNFERNFVDADGVPQTVELIQKQRFDSRIDTSKDWYTIFSNLAFWKTDVTAGEGLLTISTEDTSSGILSQTSDNYDFFKRELTYTFDGVNIQALGQSRIASQWVRFGVVANSSRQFWKNFPIFLVAVSGSGAFSLQVWQGDDRAPRKIFKSNVFNFDVSLLRNIKLTMDDTNYRVVFSFENPLDILSFGGPHNLDPDLWFVDTVGVNTAKLGMENAQRNLAAWEEALADGVDGAQAQIDFWQNEFETQEGNYNAALLLVGEIQGDSAIIISVNSDASDIVNAMTPAQKAIFDADYAAGLVEIGARVTVDAITVETTNILQ